MSVEKIFVKSFSPMSNGYPVGKPDCVFLSGYPCGVFDSCRECSVCCFHINGGFCRCCMLPS